MAGDTRALHNLSPKFIIPVGTQVVLKAEKTLPDGQFRKPGTVGVVVESPPHNAEPYVVQFADGNEARVQFAELVLRRKEIETELGDVADDLNAVYHLPLPGRLEGLWPRRGQRRRRLAGHLPAAGAPGVVALSTARAN